MADLKKFFHWSWGENNIRPDSPNYLANFEIGVVIRFDYEQAYQADYDDFYNSIADVQFLFGNRPDENEVEQILTDAYNYLCIEERLLEQDLEDFEDELDEHGI